MASVDSDNMENLKVLELYSGIGGMHCALKECGIPHEVAAAVDINNIANDIYRFNFPQTKLLQRAIESLTLKELNRLEIDMFTMSPPCQPFTRVGLQKDAGDERTKSFFHVLDLLPKLDKQPKYILLENVKGFDTSVTRESLLETLKEAGYHIQEFLLTPLQFGVPNSRLRYFLLAKRQDLAFNFLTSKEIHTSLPDCMDPYLHHKLKGVATELPKDDGRWDMSEFCTCVDQTSSGEICATCMKLRYPGKQRTKGRLVTESTKNELCSSSMNGETILVPTQDKVSDVVSNCAVLACDKSNPSHTSDGLSEPISGVNTNSTADITPQEDKLSLTSAASDPQASDCATNYKRLSEIAYIKYRSICRPVGDYLENHPEEYFENYLIPEKFFKRFWVMDIVKPHARNSCCFTKRYAHHLEGSGSVLQMATDNNVDLRAYKVDRQYNETVQNGVRSLKLRYFTPREISNVMCFPEWFDFPEELSLIQKYRVLGNSLNVHVVAILMRLLTFGDP